MSASQRGLVIVLIAALTPLAYVLSFDNASPVMSIERDEITTHIPQAANALRGLLGF